MGSHTDTEKTAEDRIPGREQPFWQDGPVRLSDSNEGLILEDSGTVCRLSGNPREPDLHIRTDHGTEITVYNAFSPGELRRKAQSGEPMRMATGNEYGTAQVCSLILLAARLGQNSMDIGYLEGCRFLALLRERGAVSEEAATDLGSDGLKNPSMMHPFLHSKKVRKTENGLYYLTEKHI